MIKLIMDVPEIKFKRTEVLRLVREIEDINKTMSQTLTDEEIGIIEYTLLRGRELGKGKQINTIIKKLKGDVE